MNYYHERILAFIDVLGFREAIGKTVECINGKVIEKLAETQIIDNLFDEINYQISIKYLFPEERKIIDQITSQFSDSIVISYSKENYIHHIFQDAYFLCVKAMESGFLLRGAIVLGKVIHSEKDKKLFGPAIIKAYEMENKKAKYPRIIIDENVFNIAKKNYLNCTNPDAEYDGLMKLVSKDYDNLYYINYIDKLYTGVDVGISGEHKHSMLVSNNLRKLKDSYKKNNKLKCKYLWLEKKYNNALTKLNQNMEISSSICDGSCCLWKKIIYPVWEQ